MVSQIQPILEKSECAIKYWFTSNRNVICNIVHAILWNMHGARKVLLNEIRWFTIIILCLKVFILNCGVESTNILLFLKNEYKYTFIFNYVIFSLSGFWCGIFREVINKNWTLTRIDEKKLFTQWIQSINNVHGPDYMKSFEVTWVNSLRIRWVHRKSCKNISLKSLKSMDIFCASVFISCWLLLTNKQNWFL